MRIDIRHFTPDDIPIRSALLRDDAFQANLTDFAVLTEDDALASWQQRTIAEEQDVKRIFTACRGNGEVIGFLWITSVDWRSQACELSFAILPRFRGGFGPPTIDAARGYLYDELNMRVVVDQVLEHNTMLHSGSDLDRRSRVRSPYDSYTVGEWRTARYWTQRRQDHRTRVAEDTRKRAETGARIRAALDGRARS
jgi:hypothetical protein